MKIEEILKEMKKIIDYMIEQYNNDLWEFYKDLDMHIAYLMRLISKLEDAVSGDERGSRE